MDCEIDGLEMYSMTDLCPYVLQPEIFLGKLKVLGTEYIKLSLLGSGSYSDVYEVKKSGGVDNEKRFAQKVISKIEQNKDLHTLVYREITILRNLDHENVIKLYEILTGEEQISLHLILEFCEYDLDKYIKYYPLQAITQDIVKCIAIHLFRGLNYLHKNYIVHRDIKPSNLLIHSNGTLKIGDFGLARRWSYNNRPSTPGRMTLWYQAPELLFEAPVYDSKVDMWSAGCVIIEVMTKKPLFGDCSTSLVLINKISRILGRPQASNWPSFQKTKFAKTMRIGGEPYNKLVDVLNGLNCTVASSLLEGLIKYDPETRFSAETCLNLDYFQQAPLPTKCIEKPEIMPYHRLEGRAQHAIKR